MLEEQAWKFLFFYILGFPSGVGFALLYLSDRPKTVVETKPVLCRRRACATILYANDTTALGHPRDVDV